MFGGPFFFLFPQKRPVIITLTFLELISKEIRAQSFFFSTKNFFLIENPGQGNSKKKRRLVCGKGGATKLFFSFKGWPMGVIPFVESFFQKGFFFFSPCCRDFFWDGCFFLKLKKNKKKIIDFSPERGGPPGYLLDFFAGGKKV